MFAQIQESFASALIDADEPVPAAVTSHTARTPAKRFSVYRNNVVVGLVNALASRFPVSRRIVGEEFFAGMARLFVVAHPPRSPMLMFYGEAFPDFIAEFPPAADVPYLCDVARLEAARTRAYHAADAESVDWSLLESLEEKAIAGLRIVPHPSAETVRSAHPIVTIWAMNTGARELGPIGDWRGEDALVVRCKLEVEVRSLPAGGAAFLAALFAGERLADAVEAAVAEAAGFDLVANLSGLMAAGAIGKILRARSPGEAS
jgi:hypothetical protein